MCTAKLDTSEWVKVRARGGTHIYQDVDGNVTAKECRECNDPVLLDGYRNDKRGLAGKVAKCTPCLNLLNREYKQANPEKIRQQRNVYAVKYAKEIAEKRQARFEANKDEMREYYRNYYKENRESILEDKRKWREANADFQNELVRDWGRRNPDKVRLMCQRRRARVSNLPDTFTHEQMKNTMEFFRGGCALTGDSNDIHWDHVIPISTGNRGTTEANMIPLRADLNKRKSSSNIFEWFEREKERLNLSQSKFDNAIKFLSQKNGMSPEEYRSFYYEQFQEKEVI